MTDDFPPAETFVVYRHHWHDGSTFLSLGANPDNEGLGGPSQIGHTIAQLTARLEYAVAVLKAGDLEIIDLKAGDKKAFSKRQYTRTGERTERHNGLQIHMQTDNAAFEDPGEVARVLRSLADRLDTCENPINAVTGRLLDSNGNSIGTYTITP